MYLKQACNSSSYWNNFLKLCLGIIIIFSLAVIFQLPWFYAVIQKISSLNDISFKNAQLIFESMGSNDKMKILDSNLNLLLYNIGFIGLLLGVILCSKINNVSFLKLTTSRSKIDIGRICFSFSITFCLSLIFLAVTIFTSPDGVLVNNFEFDRFFWLFLIAIIFIPIQTSAEEYLCRGYLMQSLGGLTKTRWFPLLLTSLLFAALHLANPEIEKYGYVVFVFYIGAAFFAGILTLMDEGLELALGWHFANNLFISLFITVENSAMPTNAILKDVSRASNNSFFDVIIPVFIIFPLMLFIFTKKYNWNWKKWKAKLISL